MDRARVFLSYSHADGLEAASFFDDELSKAECVVWRDLRRLATGDDWQEQSAKTISRVDAVILLLTPAAVQSSQVQWEWQVALTRRKRLIVYTILPCDSPAEFPPALMRKDLTTGYRGEPILLIGDLRRQWLLVDEDFNDVKQYMLERHQAGEPRALFQSAFEVIDSHLRQRPSPTLPPEVFRAIFLVLRRMIDAYPNVHAIVEEVLSGSYVLPEPYDILPYHPEAFRRVFRPIQSRLPGIPVRFVIAAMNAAEAGRLADRTALAGFPELLSEWGQAETALLRDAPEWRERYRNTELEWQPFETGVPITAIIRASLLRISEAGDCPQPLVPQFVDLRILNRPEGRYRLQDLRNGGCVLLIDAVSMRHPEIQDQLRRTALDGYATTLVARVAPSRSAVEFATHASPFLRLWFESEFDARLRDPDPKCKKAWQAADLSDWLRVELPRAIPVCFQRLPGIWRQFNRFDQTA